MISAYIKWKSDDQVIYLKLWILIYEAYSTLGHPPFKFFVDLVTESDDVFPVFLPVRWVSGFIFGKGKRIYYQASKRNGIKGHALPRQKHLTSFDNYKGGRSLHRFCLFREKDVFKLKHPNIQQESLLPKKPGAKSQILIHMLFPYSKWEHKIKHVSSQSFPLPEYSFSLALTLNFLKAKPSHSLHRKLLVYSLEV